MLTSQLFNKAMPYLYHVNEYGLQKIYLKFENLSYLIDYTLLKTFDCQDDHMQSF